MHWQLIINNIESCTNNSLQVFNSNPNENASNCIIHEFAILRYRVTSCYLYVKNYVCRKYLLYLCDCIEVLLCTYAQ